MHIYIYIYDNFLDLEYNLKLNLQKKGISQDPHIWIKVCAFHIVQLRIDIYIYIYIVHEFSF